MNKSSKPKIILLSAIIIAVFLVVIFTFINPQCDFECLIGGGMSTGPSELSPYKSPCRSGYSLIGDVCEPTPEGYVETRNPCEMAVDSMEAAGVSQNYAEEFDKCR